MTRSTKWRPLLVLLSILVSFGTLEIYMRFFFFRSEGYGFTLAAKNWQERNWRPINSFQYRDAEPSTQRFGGKRVLFVVGDSFMAGHGIDSAAHRLSNLLQDDLGGQWAVANLARNGWGTAQELEAIRTYPVDPDVIVLSYYVNDIENAAHANGMPEPELIAPPSAFLSLLVERSHLANYIYWTMFRFRNSNELEASYWNYLSRCYANDRVWRAHLSELRSLAALAREKNARLLLLVMPFLPDPSRTRNIYARVTDFLKEENIPIINLSEAWKDRERESLVVNRLDAHANPAAHIEMAGMVMAWMKAENLLASGVAATDSPVAGAIR